MKNQSFFVGVLGITILFAAAIPAIAQTTVTLPYAEDFNGTSLGSEWQFSDPSQFSVSGGVLNYNGTIGGQSLTAAVPLDNSVPTATTGIQMNADLTLTNGIVTNSDIGFAAFGDTPNFVLGGDAHYLVDMKPHSGTMRILRVHDTASLTYDDLGAFSVGTLSLDKTYQLTFEATPVAGANQLRLAIQDDAGKVLGSIDTVDKVGGVNAALLTGNNFGIRNRTAASATFDNFSLTEASLPQRVFNYDLGNGGTENRYSGLAAVADPAGINAVWSVGTQAVNPLTDSFGNASTVTVNLSPLADFGFGVEGQSGVNYEVKPRTQANALQHDYFWISQEGIDYSLANGGSDTYDVTVAGLDSTMEYNIYFYSTYDSDGSGALGTTVTVDGETYTVDGYTASPSDARGLFWSEAFEYTVLRGLSGQEAYTLALGIAPGSEALGISGVQIVEVGAAATVPEPTTWCGLAALLFGGLFFRRQTA